MRAARKKACARRHMTGRDLHGACSATWPRCCGEFIERRASMRVFPALFRMQQHPFDDLRRDIVGFHVFDRADGIETGLHQDASVDNGAPLFVAALLVEASKTFVLRTLDGQNVHHIPLPGRWNGPARLMLWEANGDAAGSINHASSKSMSAFHQSAIYMFLPPWARRASLC